MNILQTLGKLVRDSGFAGFVAAGALVLWLLLTAFFRRGG